MIGDELDSVVKNIENAHIVNINNAANFTVNIPDYKSHLPYAIWGNFIDLPRIYGVLGLNVKNILLSRESLIYHEPVKIGDQVTVRTFLKNAYEQQATANPIGFVVLESAGLVSSKLSFYAERILAVRGGFARGLR